MQVINHKLIKKGLLIFGSTVILYLSWLPKPDIGTQPYFPQWLGHWTNANGNLRTAVPFVFLAAAMEMWYYKTSEVFKRRLIILSFLIILITTAEAGQFFLPKRHFDWIDIAWGIAGSVVGITLSAILITAMSRFNKINR